MKSFSTVFKKGLMPYQKNPDRGQNRKKLRWVPTSHRTDLSKNIKVERLKNQISGRIGLNISDVVDIVNKYILQPGSDQCNTSNLNAIVNKYLKKPKALGTTGITIKSMPSNTPGMAKFFIYK